VIRSYHLVYSRHFKVTLIYKNIFLYVLLLRYFKIQQSHTAIDVISILTFIIINLFIIVIPVLFFTIINLFVATVVIQDSLL